MSDTADVKGISSSRAGAISAVAVALVWLATGGFLAVPRLPPIDLAAGLAVPLGLLLGAPAAPGVAAGVLLGGAIRSSLSWLVALDALGAFFLAYSGFRLWGVLPAVATGEDPRLGSVGEWIEFVTVTAVAGTTATAVLAWGTLVAWGGLFHAIVLREFSILLVSTLLAGPGVIYPAGRFFEDRTASYAGRFPLETGSGGFRGVVLVPVAWIVVGSILSVAIGLAQLVGVRTLVRHGFGELVILVDPAVVGDGGRRVLVAFGALMLSLVAVTYAPWAPDVATDSTEGPHRPRES